MQYVYLYLLTIPVFFIIDIIWLAFIGKKFVQSQLGHLLGPVNWTAAGIFYALYIGFILFFAVYPALQDSNAMKALMLGALLGFFAYMTYDLTNTATLKDWPLLFSLVDIVWGTVLTASVAFSAYHIGKFLGL
jgi:uncharacterized membrane protein